MRKIAFACFMTFSVCSVAAVAEDLSGYISDSHCGAKHSSVSEKATQCINGCLKGGADAVLVHDGQVMKIDADSQAKAKEFAGKQVTVHGSVSGDTVKIDSIEAAS